MVPIDHFVTDTQMGSLETKSCAHLDLVCTYAYNPF